MLCVTVFVMVLRLCCDLLPCYCDVMLGLRWRRRSSQ